MNRVLNAIVTTVATVVKFFNYPWFKAPTAAEIDAYQQELSKDWKPTPSLLTRIENRVVRYFDLQSERRRLDNGSA